MSSSKNNYPINIFVSERANLVDIAVDELLDCGATVVCVTCDSPTVQLAMMKQLGADLRPESLDLQICRDKPGPPIYFLHDMCHALKLVRNGWHFHKIIKNSNNEHIDWKYIVELYRLQNTEHLKCANKLTHTHVYFNNNKMKVKYAAQVLSRSVALSLKFCREELNLPQFQGSEATEEFLIMINNIFDIMNSRSKFSSSFSNMKNAMSEDNQEDWGPVLERTKTYILGLTTVRGDSMTTKDSRKTGFMGIVCNIEAVMNIFNNNVDNGLLLYLCTYKLSQDPLEHFFGLIRARFGANNNPTPYQFKKIFRRILLGVLDKIVENGNVELQDATEMVAIIPLATDKLAYIYENYDFDDDEMNVIIDLNFQTFL